MIITIITIESSTLIASKSAKTSNSANYCYVFISPAVEIADFICDILPMGAISSQVGWSMVILSGKTRRMS